jgi:hypothetical protein
MAEPDLLACEVDRCVDMSVEAPGVVQQVKDTHFQHTLVPSQASTGTPVIAESKALIAA